MSKIRPFKDISNEPIDEERTETELDCALNFHQSPRKQLKVDLEAWVRRKIPIKKKAIFKEKEQQKQNLIYRT